MRTLILSSAALLGFLALPGMAEVYDPYTGPDPVAPSLRLMAEPFAATEALGPVSVSIRSLNSQTFPFVFLDVDATDETSTCTLFSAENFQVLEDGVAQKDYFAVTPPNENQGVRLVDIVFIMDNSGSMSDDQLAVRNNVYGFVDKLAQAGINYAFGLTRYGQGANSGAPLIEDNGNLTSDAAYFKDTVWTRNTIDGGTEPGYRAIVDSAAKFNYRPGSRRVFIIVTDESPNQGGATLDQAAAALQSGDVTLFAVTATSLFSSFQSLVADPSQQLLGLTTSFDQIFTAVTDLLADTYRVTYKAQNETIDGLERAVEVQVTCGAETGSDTTTYMPGSEPKIARTQETTDLSATTQPAQTALTIAAQVTDQAEPLVQTDGVRLYYRPTTTDSNAPYKFVKMTRIGGDNYSVSIPSSDVLEPGVDYYISATDGVSNVTDPKVEASLRPYAIAVFPNEPPLLVLDLITDAEEGEPIGVCVEADDTTDRLEKVVLHFRALGELTYESVTMQPSDGPPCSTSATPHVYDATIPADRVTLKGVEYYIEAVDNYGTRATLGAADQPAVITVSAAGNKPYVVFIPGFLGSRLYRPGTFELDRVWETIYDDWFNSDFEYLRLCDSDVGPCDGIGEPNPDRPAYLGDPDDIIGTPDDDQNERGIIGEVHLDGKVPLVEGRNVYKSAIDYFNQRLGQDHWRTVPWDWRLSVEDPLTLVLVELAIRSLVGDSGEKVVIVAHSTGGLVAKAYLEQYGSRQVSRLISVAVPHFGTPQALPELLHGDMNDWPNGFIPKKEWRDAGRRMKSTHQLLPSDAYIAGSDESVIDVLDLPRVFAVSDCANDPGEDDWELNNYDFKSYLGLSSWLQEHTLMKPGRYDDTTRPLELSGQLLDVAEGFHSAFDGWVPDIPVDLIAGTNVATVEGIDYGHEYLLRDVYVAPSLSVRKWICKDDVIYDIRENRKGDGTVPVASALGMPDHENIKKHQPVDLKVGRNASHSTIFAHQGIQKLLDQVLGVSETVTVQAQALRIASVSALYSTGSDVQTRIRVFGDVALHVYDESGQHTGYRASGNLGLDFGEEAVPGSSYRSNGYTQIVWIPGTLEIYRTEIVPRAQTQVVVRIEQYIGDERVAQVDLPPVDLGDNGRLNVIGSESLEETKIAVDTDGDGVSERVLPILSPLTDTFPPVSAHTLVGAMGENGWYVSDVAVSLSANDGEGVGVQTVFYALDNSQPQAYTNSNGISITSEGVHTLTYYAVDYFGNQEEPHTVAVKIDKTAPVVTASLSPDILWPPNHKMVQVQATVTASDTCDPSPAVSPVSVTSNEPDSGTGYGDTPNDIVILNDTTFKLRAERSGAGSGRIYTIMYEVADAAGNTSQASAKVTVPHDKGKKGKKN
ncbi:von Willebrand factor type A [Thiocapsa marina 5811]|uniref:von Willebrand factor type A n=2 Tax=Thiocapsa marina TaxID=244573 RepID=F9UHT2_9GAMM|nr:von Willebrand factor type A [Thiocapsa marina 5811]